MTFDPSYLPTDDAPVEAPPQPAPAANSTPNIGHTVIFAFLLLGATILSSIGFALSMKHILPYVHESTEQMKTDPRVVIPLEAVMYALAAAASLVVFPLVWRRSFGEGVHWRAAVVRHRWWMLAVIGVATSIMVQVLSNFLPIPKELPIDKFFTNRIGVWLVAIFGVTVAPAFEELAFRGFLLPSLASAWDWVVGRGERARRLAQATEAPVWNTGWTPGPGMDASQSGYALQEASEQVPSTDGRSALDISSLPTVDNHPDPSWSLPAVIFSTIVTSIGFAFLHSDQLARSLAPLSVLFVVSLVLSVTRLRFHSLAASTLVHSLYNATIFVMLFIGTDGFRHLDKLSK